MTDVTEIAPKLYRLSTFVPEAGIQFNQFLATDDEPLLFHTGPGGLFGAVRDVVGRLMDPAGLRWIGFSHFEADECGALREWQEAAPDATAACSLVAKVVSVDDTVAARPARPLKDGEVIETGSLRFRFLRTPQVPHAWDAGLLFEETGGTLLASDLFHQNGDVEPVTRSDVVGRFRAMLAEYEGGPMAGYLPWTPRTRPTLERLAALEPKTIAPMHGSTFVGDGARALRDLAAVMEEVLGVPPPGA